MRTLIVVDMQNDFITGRLGTPEAVAIVPKVKAKIEEYRALDWPVVFTQDTHFENYLDTTEGKKLPVKHCVMGTRGWQIVHGLSIDENDRFIEKYTFGFSDWDKLPIWKGDFEIVGVCTDICVISNALILKALAKEMAEITVDASCCAGTTPENHKAALQVMKACQIDVVNE